MGWQMYKHTFLSQKELKSLLEDKISPWELNTVISAYEVAENAYEGYPNIDGTPFFFHPTRVCSILINELNNHDHNILTASLLHDIYKYLPEIKPEIIEYNFGPYVAFLVDMLSMDAQHLNSFPREFICSETKSIKFPADDYLMIWLAEHLDNIRCLDFDIKFNPVPYLKEIGEKFLPLAENSTNPAIKYLATQIRKERNKIIG